MISINVKQMAERSGLPAATFNRRFKRATGFSPAQYLQHVRVEKAKQWLEQSDTPVDEISYQAGYEEAAAFRRMFKRITTLSPGEYRRKFRIRDAVPPL